MKCGLLFALLLLIINDNLLAQDEAYTKISNTPSKEVYDLLQDKRGFIWIGDNLGVRRFDGVSFTSYSYPAQSSISMSGLCEDRFGRIWCHNFSGQIFYIENEKMHLLTGYDYASERDFPRIAMCGDDLVATSAKGLFVCNTITLKCRYLPIRSGTTSLCVTGNKTVLFSDGKWYVYQKDSGVSPVEVSQDKFTDASFEHIILYPYSYKHNVYATLNPGSSLYTFTLADNYLHLISVRRYNAFINTVSVKGEEAWVHTKTASTSLNDSETISNLNLSCILKDKLGNHWYSSLDKGLLVKYAPEKWSIIKSDMLSNGDFIRCMKLFKKYFVWGSQQGRVLVTDTLTHSTETFKLPPGAGAVERLKQFDDHLFFVEASTGLYLLNPEKHSLKTLEKDVVAKDVAIVADTLYIATPRGILRTHLDTNDEKPLRLGNELFKRKQRCRSLCYDAYSGSVFIAYSDGLYQLKNNKLSPVLYKNEPIYASSLQYHDKKIFAGTFSGGFITLESINPEQYKLENRSVLNAVLRIKISNNHIWIVKTSGINTFESDSSRFIYNRELSYLNGSDIYDLEEVNNSVFVSTAESIYQIPLDKQATVVPPNLYLLYCAVNNNHNINFLDKTKFPPKENNLSFHFSTPWLYENSSVSVRYTLNNINKSSDDTLQWYYLEPNERIIQFNSLKPGSYELRVETGINGDFQYSAALHTYHFTIRKPWYNHWWFYLLLSLIFVLLFISFYQYRIFQLTRIERLRRQISSDLHDDIGSTISSINIYSQLIKSGKKTEEYIDIIQANTVQVISNLDDVVWNINPKNDSIAQLVNRMKLFAQPYLTDNNIICEFESDVENEGRLLSPEVRTDFYLVLKEAVNNIVKHSDCTTCRIRFTQKRKMLELNIFDNGKGFDVNTTALHRNGLTTMQTRARQLHGSLIIDSEPGKGTSILLTCRI